MQSDEPIIFIVGVGRSGTSLLQSMLATHRDICFLPETQFLRKYLFAEKKYKLINKKGAAVFQKILNEDLTFKRLNISVEECVKKENFSVKNVYQNILKIYSSTTAKKISGDKDPRYLDFIKAIYNHFPEAKILHIIRDPRDVILSRTKAAWSSKWPLLLHACIYNAQLLRGRKIGFKLFNEQYFELFYEDLIERPETELKRLCEWLNVAYDPNMLNYQEVAKGLVSAEEMQWKKEILGPLLNKNKEKWKNVFSPFQIALIQSVCKPSWKQLPYTRMNNLQLSQFEKIKIIFAKFFSGIFNIFYPLRLKLL